MFKKVLIGGITFAGMTVLLAACGTNDSNSGSSASSSDKTSQSAKSSSEKSHKEKYGQIIGKDTSEDKSAKEITKPGDSVSFEVPASSNEEYLHFAFMHAASGAMGWYFAPAAESGVALSKSMFEDDKTVDITDQIALFEAPNQTTSMAVTEDNGSLKYGEASDFMKATVTKEDNMYKITIENTSSGDFETPFSSGVWSVSDSKDKAFDHTASQELSTLATSGKRADLYNEVKDEMK